MVMDMDMDMLWVWNNIRQIYSGYLIAMSPYPVDMVPYLQYIHIHIHIHWIWQFIRFFCSKFHQKCEDLQTVGYSRICT